MNRQPLARTVIDELAYCNVSLQCSGVACKLGMDCAGCAIRSDTFLLSECSQFKQKSTHMHSMVFIIVRLQCSNAFLSSYS